jgi:hypothetical protein
MYKERGVEDQEKDAGGRGRGFWTRILEVCSDLPSTRTDHRLVAQRAAADGRLQYVTSVVLVIRTRECCA